LISFASSIWLWAIAGVAIPVLIHLWNVRKGRTKKIGSIMFFTETAVSRARSLRLSDLFLLLLRCLLFIMIAFFVARPLFSTMASAGEKGWVLMERSLMTPLHQQYGSQIDSLLDKGFELHEFGGEFRAMKLSDSTTREKSGRGYWQLLTQLENKIPPGMPVYIFSGSQLNRFTGNRPVVNLNMQWKTVGMDSSVNWIESAYTDYKDSVVVVTGTAHGKGTSFTSAVLPLSVLKSVDQQLYIEYKGRSAPVDTSSLTIGIYAEPGTKDGRYLSAAIESAREFSGRKIKIISVDQADKSEHLDWLFWLSTQKIPGKLKARNVFRYNGEKNKAGHIAFSPGPFGTPVPVYQIYSYADLDSAKTWQTGTGETIMAHHAKTNQYLFYSRLDPAWNEWVWQDEFPQFILDLIYPRLPGPGTDHRIIDPAQLMPTIGKGRNTNATVITKDVSPWFWIIAFVLLLMERLIVYRRQKHVDG
jgi:hypothetical protein